MAQFTWGQTVRVKVGAPLAARAGATAEIVGVGELGAEGALDRELYVIEFGDGSSVEIARVWLEACTGA